jgi:double-strand break repair protein AddB
LLAGSTGSRGTTALLMQAVARLPQGAVVLPGFDFDQTEDVWRDLSDAMTSEDHPQYRFSRLMDDLAIGPRDIRRWTAMEPPSPARNRLISLSLRPAPFTDAWLREGPELPAIEEACRDMTLIEAPGPKEEAMAIALRLRQAAEDGETAALITPDRMLTRRVAAALDRWGILPDDSAGLPLQLSPPGRFLRHVAELFSERLTGEGLLTLLKHPLCHTGSGRGEHLRRTRDLELHLRKNGPPFPTEHNFRTFAAGQRDISPEWVDWLCRCFEADPIRGEFPLDDWVMRLRQTAEELSCGSLSEGSGELWEKNAGERALSVIDALTRDAEFGDAMTAREFGDLLGALLASEEVRDRDAPHPWILIWGTLEARVQGADLLILGSLNEGSWPEASRPDPWLNRKLRLAAGLLLPERRIGLSAHDYQQAVAAKSVFLTRSEKTEDAETVPSRWLNRLTNLLSGLQPQGAVALQGMRKRGAHWLALVQAAEEAPYIPPAHRPSPKPPAHARPKQMSVTEIKKLIRDPYAIYARHVLNLRPLDPVVREPDALLRGIVVHDVLERFVKATLEDSDALSDSVLLETASAVLSDKVPWPMAQRLWLARLARVSHDFVVHERVRQIEAAEISFEARASLDLHPLDFKLTGRADRIDRMKDGRLVIYDYKTGSAPSRPVQKNFDKQLLIEAAMAEEGAFERLDPSPVARAVFIGLGGGYNEVAAPLEEEPPAKVLQDLRDLIGSYLSETQGFTARRAMQKDSDKGDFDHLARFGEWDRSADAEPEDLI